MDIILYTLALVGLLAICFVIWPQQTYNAYVAAGWLLILIVITPWCVIRWLFDIGDNPFGKLD
jgi:uncharacterized membrane protein YqjE